MTLKLPAAPSSPHVHSGWCKLNDVVHLREDCGECGAEYELAVDRAGDTEGGCDKCWEAYCERCITLLRPVILHIAGSEEAAQDLSDWLEKWSPAPADWASALQSQTDLLRWYDPRALRQRDEMLERMRDSKWLAAS